MKREIILEICMDLNRGRISAEGAADLIMLQNTAPNSEYEATPKSCRTCINKYRCSLITQLGCKNNGYFMWEEA